MPSVTQVLLSLSAVASAAAYTTAPDGRTEFYYGQKVLACNKTGVDGAAFDALTEEYLLDIWGETPELVDVRAPTPEAEGALKYFFPAGCSVVVEDVEADMQAFDEAVAAAPKGGNWHTEYHRYAETLGWYEALAAENPDLITYTNSIGTSVEGRRIPALRVSGNADRKDVIYMQCQIHAREWISSATCMYMLEELIKDYRLGDAEARDILDNSDLHIVPITNPDGYEFTHTDTRLWRKNRSNNSGSSCIGTDLNRNYDDHWGQGGSSTNPCSDTFMGRSPASEPEVAATQAYFNSLAPVIGAIDWHAYSQLILRPYGWTRDLSPDETRIRQIGADMASAITRTSGLTYRNIRSTELYVTTGSASDWFYGEGSRNNGGKRAAGITMELRPVGANPGFQLPPSEIIPTGEENYEAFKVYCRELIREPLTGGPQ